MDNKTFKGDEPYLKLLSKIIQIDTLEERLNKFYLICKNHDGKEFDILSNVFKVFIEFGSKQLEEEWVLGDKDTRLSLMATGIIRNPKLIAGYFLNKSRKLEFSYGHFNDPFYNFADLWLKWIAFNDKDAYRMLGDAFYVLPEEDDFKQTDIKGYG